MSMGQELRVTLEMESGYAFRVRFDGTALDDLHTDEPAPLGAGEGPNPSRLLLVSLANCLSASLLFALRKFKNEPLGLVARASAQSERNAEGRWRIAKVRVELELADGSSPYEHLERTLAQFEEFCVVTQSVRQGIAVEVVVRDAAGQILLGNH